MLRRFKFEDEVYASLSCVPMAVRRKLDRVGIKVSLADWQKLNRGERLAICHLPTESAEECEVMRLFVDEAVRNRGGQTKPLSDEVQRSADAPVEPPAALINRARDAGCPLDAEKWRRLDSDEQYALIKLGAGAEPSRNLAAALHEFLNR